MRRYLLLIKQGFITFEGTLSTYFHRFAAVTLWTVGILGLSLILLIAALLAHRAGGMAPTPMDTSGQTALPKLPQMDNAVFPTVQSSVVGASTNTSTISENSNQGSSVKADLHVNNQPIPLPTNGSVHKEIVSGNGKTTIDVSVGSTTSGSTSSDSSMNVILNSTTESSTDSSSSP